LIDAIWCWPAHRREHLRRQQFNRLCHLGVWQAADVDLAEKPIVSEELALVYELVDDLLGAADEDRARGAGALLVNVTRNLAHEVGARRVFAEIGAVVRIELLEGSLRVLRYMDMCRYGNLQRACVVSSFGVTLPVGSDLAGEVGRRPGDVCKDQGQAEVAGPQCTFRIAADAEPDRELADRPR
jgi:hypothetical protein